MVDEKVIPENLNVTPQFIAALTQVVWTQMGMLPARLARHHVVGHHRTEMWAHPGLTCSLESVTQDLESFARHAGRTTISTDDVLLLCRRNNDMHQIIKDFIDKEKAEKAAAGKGKGARR